MASTLAQHRAPFRVSSNNPSRRDYTRIEVTYYRFKRPNPSPAPKPSPIPFPHDPYTLINVPKPTTRLPQPPVRGRHHSSDSHGNTFQAKHRRVHFADEPTVITYRPDAPHAREASPDLPPPPPPPKPQFSRTSASVPFAAPPAASCPPHIRTRRTKSDTGTSRLHDYLLSFPEHLWDVRRHPSPSYDPHHTPRFCEPVFPSDPSGSTGRRSIRLVFIPCQGRAELSWFMDVTPGSQNYLVVGDVLRAISVELYRRRSVCRDPGAGHPCSGVRATARRELRANGVCTSTPGCHDKKRNVDLFQGDGGYHSLWFRGLEEQTLSDGEVVYRVVFGYG